MCALLLENTMMKHIFLLTCLVAAAAAQFPVAGTNSATAYGQWTVRATTSVSAGSDQMFLSPGQVTAIGFGSFPAVTNGTPLYISDGADSETVTPSEVSCPMNAGSDFSCSFTATFVYAHNAGVEVSSGSDGLQEAVNALLSSGGTVVIPYGWGGTTAMITGATGAGNVLVSDTRPPLATYGWNGSGYSAVLTASAAGVIASQPLAGSCTGTATSSATLGLFGMGNFGTTACTSTTVTLGPTVRAGTLRNLTVTAGTHGVSANSGVVTVLDNGSPTALTCTLGTSTACSDSTHTASTNVGDVITIEFTTQASETLAGVRASVILQ
jgi:hypothetical protein